MVVWPERTHAGVAEIQEIDKLDFINTVDYLAGGNVLNWPAVYELDNATILQKLRHDSIHARYEKAIWKQQEKR